MTTPVPSVLLLSGWAYPPAALAALAGALAAQTRLEVRDPLDFLVTPRVPLPAADIVVGWSLGAMLALQATAAGQLRPRALILLSATPRFCADTDFAHGQPAARVRAMARGLTRDAAATVRDFHQRCASPAAAHAERLEARTAASLAQGTQRLATGLQYLQDSDLRSQIGEVRCPAFLLHGTEDAIVPTGASEWLAAHLAGSERTTLRDAGHDLPIAEAPWVASQLQKYIARFQ